MMSRRSLLALMVASVMLSGVHATPVQAAAVGSNMRKFVAREAAKQTLVVRPTGIIAQRIHFMAVSADYVQQVLAASPIVRMLPSGQNRPFAEASSERPLSHP
jgi:hypothetical protein